MSRIRKLFTGTAIVAGASVALLTAGSANAEPAPAPAPPAVPGMDMLQQFVANPAGAIQAATSLLTLPNLGAAAPAPAAPPLATASVSVPNATGLPAVDAAAPALAVPSIPGVPLPAGVSIPPNLTSLIPAGTPSSTIPTLGNSTTVPGAAQPITPPAPVGAALGPLFPVSALP
ncbi:MAG: hypothetical protein K0R68_1044 [Mycobacterium sp.]|jgi:hypothetical protein|nr:hypothetical protein [Mycobacterium sp.]